MTAIHTFRPRAMSSDNTSSQIYFLVAVVLIISLIGLRVTTLRRRNQTLSEFFRFNGGSQYPQPPNDTSYGSSYRPYGTSLARPPAAYHPDRRVRSADTDAQGRRLGPAGEDFDGKDALPAYDNLDRPPKYVEASWSQAPPHAPDQSAGASAGEPSGNLRGTTNADGPARIPPVHQDSSSS